MYRPDVCLPDAPVTSCCIEQVSSCRRPGEKPYTARVEHAIRAPQRDAWAKNMIRIENISKQNSHRLLFIEASAA
ncbi:MAG: hypothetical protein SV862_02190, partial [Pseudomonadota bacterium]|nr:hypothetical protein [Pseudomonadota bacterium]